MPPSPHTCTHMHSLSLSLCSRTVGLEAKGSLLSDWSLQRPLSLRKPSPFAPKVVESRGERKGGEKEERSGWKTT